MTVAEAPIKEREQESDQEDRKVSNLETIRQQYIQCEQARSLGLIKLGYYCREYLKKKAGSTKGEQARRDARAAAVSEISRSLMPLGMSPRPTEMQVNRWCLFSALHERFPQVDQMPQGTLIHLSRWLTRVDLDYTIDVDADGEEYPLADLIKIIENTPGVTAQQVRLLMDGEEEQPENYLGQETQPSTPSNSENSPCTTARKSEAVTSSSNASQSLSESSTITSSSSSQPSSSPSSPTAPSTSTETASSLSSDSSSSSARNSDASTPSSSGTSKPSLTTSTSVSAQDARPQSSPLAADTAATSIPSPVSLRPLQDSAALESPSPLSLKQNDETSTKPLPKAASASGSASSNSSTEPGTPTPSDTLPGAESPWTAEAQATQPLEKPMSITRTSAVTSPEQLAQMTADEIARQLMNPAVAQRLFARDWSGPMAGILQAGASAMIKHDAGANISAVARLFVAIAPTVLRLYEYDTQSNKLKPKQRVVEM